MASIDNVQRSITRVAALACALALACAQQPRKGVPMDRDWLTSRLTEAGFGLVSFHYVQERPSPGVSAAAASSRVWQEQLLTPAFEIAPGVVPGVHHRSAGESDALEFAYHTLDYAVRAFHSMDRLVVILRPLEGAPQGAPEAIARLLFRDSAPIKLVREQTKDGVTIGRQRAEADPPQPWIDSMVWWSGNGETGFAVEKAVALEPGNEPSTAGFSSQQVWMWFDTFGSRRRAP